MRDHPCFSCTLPDCDERSKACALRKAYNASEWKRKRGLPLDAAERLAKREMEKTFELERKLRAQGTLEQQGVREATRHA